MNLELLKQVALQLATEHAEVSRTCEKLSAEYERARRACVHPDLVRSKLESAMQHVQEAIEWAEAAQSRTEVLTPNSTTTTTEGETP